MGDPVREREYKRLWAARQRQLGVPQSVVHGTYTAYTKGCRCRSCKDAQNAYSRERSRRKRAERPAEHCPGCGVVLIQLASGGKRKWCGPDCDLSRLAFRLGEHYLEADRGFATPCWEWQRCRTSAGYGMVTGVDRYAHRVSYEMAHGPIPDGLEIDHLCRTPACINPEHLEAVAHPVNNRRAVAVDYQAVDVDGYVEGRVCLRGHAFDDANTYMRPDGGRACRKCAAERARRKAAA